jgi:hypothetical protein
MHRNAGIKPRMTAPGQVKARPLRHRLMNNRISKSMAKKITMMASSHNILCSFNSV